MALTPKQLGRQESFGNQTVNGATVALASKTENYRSLLLAQTTAGINVLLPNPSDTSISFAIDVFNSGTADITVNGLSVPASGANRIGWNPTSLAFESVAGTSTGSTNVQSGLFGVAPAADTIYVDPALGPFDFQNTNKVTAYDTATATHFDKLLVERATKNVGSATYITAGGNFQFEWNTTVFVQTNTGTIKFFDGFYEGQTVIAYRDADWSVTQPTFTSFAGTTFIANANAPVGNNISAIMFLWRDALNIWEATYVAAGASGDVKFSGAVPVDNAVARYDLTTGKLIQNSLVTIDDLGSVAGVKNLDMTGKGNQRVTNIVVNASGTYNVDASLGNIFRVLDNAPGSQNINIDIINPPTGTTTQVITLLFQLNADTVTFANKIRFPSNQTLPVMTAGRIHMLTLMSVGTATGGDQWFCTSSLDYISLY